MSSAPQRTYPAHYPQSVNYRVSSPVPPASMTIYVPNSPSLESSPSSPSYSLSPAPSPSHSSSSAPKPRRTRAKKKKKVSSERRRNHSASEDSGSGERSGKRGDSAIFGVSRGHSSEKRRLREYQRQSAHSCIIELQRKGAELWDSVERLRTEIFNTHKDVPPSPPLSLSFPLPLTCPSEE